MNKKGLVSIAWMLGVFTIAAAFEFLYAQAEAEAGRAFAFTPLLWLKVAFSLGFAAAIVGLVWYALFQGERNKVASLAFIGLGLLVLFSLTLPGYYFWSGIFRAQGVAQILVTLAASSLSLVSAGGAFMAVIGIIGLTSWAQREG